MLKVPQAVPVEKLKNAAITNTMAGSRKMGKLAFARQSLTNSGVCKMSRHTEPMVQARNRMQQAGIMVLKPTVTPFINWRKVMSFRGTNMMRAAARAPKPPHTKDFEVSQLPKALPKFM